MVAGGGVLILAGFAAIAVRDQWFSDLRGVELLPYLPTEDAVIAGLDVARLRQGGIIDLLAGSKASEEPDYQQFVARTGFDYRTDLDSALLAFRGGVNYMLLRGRFNWNKLQDYAKLQGGSCRLGRCELPGSRPNRKISFFRLRGKVLALAVSPDGAADQEMSRKHPLPPEFAPPEEPVWAWISSHSLREGFLPTGLRAFASAIEGAERITLGMDAAGDRFELRLNVLCKTAQDATVAVAQLDTTTAMLNKLIAREKQTPNPSDLSGVLTAGKFRRDDRWVRGAWPVERVFLERLAGGSR
jgi:hypothetical protein